MFKDLGFDYNLRYGEAFALIGFLNGLVFGVCFLVASYIIYKLSVFLKNKAMKKHVVFSTDQLVNQKGLHVNSSADEYQSFLEAEEEYQKKSRCSVHQILYAISSILSWLGTIILGFIPSFLSGLGLIPVPVSILIILIVATFKYFGLVTTYCPNFIKADKDRTYTTCWSKIKRFLKIAVMTTKLYKYRFSAYIIIAVIFSFAVPLVTMGMCLTYFNTGYGIGVGTMHFSSKFGRYLELNTVCPQGQICHVYATLPEDSSSSVFINVHTGNDISTLQVNYDTLANHQAAPNDALNHTAFPSSYYTDLETRGDRYVHSVYLGNLTNNTMYYFEIAYNGAVQGNGTYMTLPSKNMERNITLAAGGDVGNTPMAVQMTSTVKGYSPDIILIGGDLAYDNGLPTCYYSYDMFLNMLASINPSSGRLIPYMFSIGNHDVGFNAMQAPSDYDVTKNLYYTYFPQHSVLDSQGNPQVPDLVDRSTYFYHLVGNSIHISLDSGYMADYVGPQLDFLNSTIANFTDYVKFANYHVPINPVCSNTTDDVSTHEQPQLNWAPLFEEHRFATIFENHAHLFKKTYPLVNGQPDELSENAVIYVGDGNWGVTPNDCTPDPTKDIFEVRMMVNNLWMVELTSSSITLSPVDQTGASLYDPFSLNVANYVGY